MLARHALRVSVGLVPSGARLASYSRQPGQVRIPRGLTSLRRASRRVEPDGDRREFVEAPMASIQPLDRPPFDESWRETTGRRSAELRSGKVTPVPWDEVKDRAPETTGA